jgi:hypothetical protein
MPTIFKFHGKPGEAADTSPPAPSAVEEEDAEKGETDANLRPREKSPSSRPHNYTERYKYAMDWEEPNDSQNSTNWTSKKNWKNVLIVNTITLITSVFHPSQQLSNMNPGLLHLLCSHQVSLPCLMKDFDLTNIELVSFVASVYILGFSFSPLCVSLPNLFPPKLNVNRIIALGANSTAAEDYTKSATSTSSPSTSYAEKLRIWDAYSLFGFSRVCERCCL